MRGIRINHPGDGDFVMKLIGGRFSENSDHVIAVHRDEHVIGGVVYTGFTGGAIFVHMAGISGANLRSWAYPDFLWMVFDYAFHQLGVRRLMGLVDATNQTALEIDRRLGFEVAAVLPDMTADGGAVYILTMHRDQWAASKFAKIKPRLYRREWENSDGW